MTKPDYRALCDELLDELEVWSSWHDATDLKDRAGAALDLTQPEPVVPTDEEIMELMPQQMRDDLATASRTLAELVSHASAATYRIILNRHAVDHARAVLAKWGNQ